MEQIKNENKNLHLSQQQISDWLDGIRAKEVATHVYNCEKCAQKLNLAANIEGLVSATNTEFLPEDFTINLVEKIYPIKIFEYKETFLSRYGILISSVLVGFIVSTIYILKPDFLGKYLSKFTNVFKNIFTEKFSISDFYLSSRSSFLNNLDLFNNTLNSFSFGKFAFLAFVVVIFLYVVDKTSNNYISKKR